MKDGFRAGLPLALPTLALGISFGVLSRPVIGPVASIVMSVVVFSGGAQFATVSVLAAGGAALPALAAGVLVNARLLAMGFALGPFLRGGPLRRLVQAQPLVDASFVIAARDDGSFDPERLFGATLPQVSSWMAGTAIGVLGGAVLGDPRSIGLDAVFVAFYLALLWEAADRRRTLLAAALGAAVAIALMPFAPVGVPIVAASAAALIGLRV